MLNALHSRTLDRRAAGARLAAGRASLRFSARFMIIAASIACFATPLRGVTQIIGYVDPGGQRLYVSADDPELGAVVSQHGVTAGLRLVERRKRSLAGIEDLIDSVSRSYSVDPELVRAVIDVESAWNPRARSRKGALGLMQLLPETGARLGVRHFFDPEENVTGGIRYLRSLLDQFDGDLTLALAAYNAGENAVSLHGGVPPYPETRQYVANVQARYRPSASACEPHAIYAMQENGRVIFGNY